MRGFIGVLVIGGIVAILGTTMGRQGRGFKMWNKMWKQGMNMLGGKRLNRLMRKGRRMIRNMGWT